MSTSDGITAANILTAALGHMRDRAATYDKPEGERSMGATVDAFLAVTGVSMTEEQGWLFMALLKAVRSQQGAYRADSYEDGAAYFALAGEAAVRDRNGGWTDKEIKAAALPRCGPMCATCHTIHGTQDRCPAVEPASAIDDDSLRMQIIGQSGEMASEVYAAVDGWVLWNGGECPVMDGTLIDTRHRDGELWLGSVCGQYGTRTAPMFWTHTGDKAEVIAYRLHAK